MAHAGAGVLLFHRYTTDYHKLNSLKIIPLLLQHLYGFGVRSSGTA